MKTTSLHIQFKDVEMQGSVWTGMRLVIGLGYTWITYLQALQNIELCFLVTNKRKHSPFFSADGQGRRYWKKRRYVAKKVSRPEETYGKSSLHAYAFNLSRGNYVQSGRQFAFIQNNLCFFHVDTFDIFKQRLKSTFVDVVKRQIDNYPF